MSGGRFLATTDDHGDNGDDRNNDGERLTEAGGERTTGRVENGEGPDRGSTAERLLI